MIKLTLGEVMHDKNMNIQQLHDRSGVARNTIRLMMNNEPKGIQFESLNKLIEVLNCTVEDIIQYIPGSITFSFSDDGENTFLNFRTESQNLTKKVDYEMVKNYIILDTIEDGKFILQQLAHVHPLALDLFYSILTAHVIDSGKIKENFSTVIVYHEGLTKELNGVQNITTLVSLKSGGVDNEAITYYSELIYLDGKDKKIHIEDNEVRIEFY